MSETSTYIANKTRVKLSKAPSEDVGVVVWDVRWDGQVIGRVLRTGEYGRDTYPWDWLITDYKLGENARRVTGNADTRRDSVSQLVRAATGEIVWW